MHLSPGLIAAFSNELTKLGLAGAFSGAAKALSTGARRAAGSVAAPAGRLSLAAGQQSQRLAKLKQVGSQAVPAQASPLSGLFAGIRAPATGRAPIPPSLRGMRAPAPSAGAPVSFAPNPQLTRAFSGGA